MLHRTHDAAAVNWLVNHPDVRPFVGPAEMGELDLSAAVEAPENWFLLGEYGGFALTWSAPRVYEVHTFILKPGRGKWGNAIRAEGIRFAKDRGAKILWTRIPPRSPHVERFARQGGMQPSGEVIKTLGIPYRIFSMEIKSCLPQ